MNDEERNEDLDWLKASFDAQEAVIRSIMEGEDE